MGAGGAGVYGRIRGVGRTLQRLGNSIKVWKARVIYSRVSANKAIIRQLISGVRRVVDYLKSAFNSPTPPVDAEVPEVAPLQVPVDGYAPSIMTDPVDPDLIG